MKSFKILLPLVLMVLAANALALTPRIVFEKYLFADGVNPQARYLNRLMVKYFDEDMVRLRDGQLVSTNARNALAFTQDFLGRHPEITVKKIITDMSEEDYAAMIERNEQMSGKDLVDLFSFYQFYLPTAAADPKALLADILNAPEVEIAYYECIPYQTLCTDVGDPTPNFRPNQTFHDAAPTGVDADYVWSTFGEDLTDGVTTNETAVIEYQTDFHSNHEDFTTVVMATPEEAADTTGYHGTSVAGVVGACEENGIGVVGLTADHTIRYYSITALATVAAVYNRVNAQLGVGDYTTGSWGYFSDPMPPGQSCPCNSGQNGMVPAEYDPATKTAIDNGVAGGIHYLESAGNGCTNLDDPTFGTVFRWSTDTGAMLVGGIRSALPHDSICYTCYGERVTLCAWADGIVTTGRGTLFAGNGRREYYNASFGGTSGAGPIVAGCGGILNNIYRDLNGGANISPTTLRSWLASGGTEPATTPPGNIGVMPNLFAITAPDLNADARTGWTNVIVPRNTNDADGSSAVLPANLNSDPSATYWNASIENTSYFGTATPGRFRVYRDDVTVVTWLYTSMSPQFRGYGINHASNARGGRHTLRCESDPLDEVVEYWEAANSGTQQNWVQQHVWDPRDLTAETPLTFTQPPTKFVTGQTGSYYNCDGYAFTTDFTGYWSLLGAVSSTTAADYDTRIYSEAITSTNGFDDYEAWSTYAGPIDIVGRNSNIAGTVSGAAVINWDGENDNYRVEGETSTYIGTPQFGRNDAGTFTIDAAEIMEAVEFRVDTAGRNYEIEADVSAGNANLVISVFGPDDGYFALSNRNATVNANGAGESEHLCFTPTQTGYHLALFHKYDSNDYNQTSTFHAYIGKSQFDLTHNLNAGWSHEIVIRQVTGQGQPAVLPATLPGNVSTNRFNMGLLNDGCVATPTGLNTAFYLDGPLSYTTTSMVTWPAGSEGYLLDQGPVFVFGGRHNPGGLLDVNDEGAEWLENNNRHDEQFVWTPYGMTNQTPYLTGVTAPNWRNQESSVSFSAWNQDGWRYTGSYWSGVAMVPTNVADNYLCMLYNPTTGSTDGFDTQLVPSFNGAGGGLNFVVENGNVNGVGSTFDVGVTNNWAWPGTPSVGAYRTYQCNRILDLSNNALNGPFTLGLNHLIHVYDLYLAAGDTSRIILDNLGATDLGLAVYAAGLAYGSRTNNGTFMNSAGDGGDETIVYVPTVTGYHGIVVFKNDLTDLASTDYRLIIGDRIPAAPLGMVLKVVNSATNPIQMLAHWDSVTTDINGGAMNVDQYQLFYTLTPNPAPFPTGWVAYLTTPLATINFNVDVSVVNFRMVVVAQDSDGLILAHSPLPDGGDATGTRLSTGSPTGGRESNWVIGQNLERPPGDARE